MSDIHPDVYIHIFYLSIKGFFFWQSPECNRLCVYLGFTTQQAETIVSVSVKTMEANMDIVYKDMVTKVQQVSLSEHWANFKSKGGVLFVI